MGARYRLVCHKCKVRLELGYNYVEIDYEKLENFYNKLVALIDYAHDCDIESKEDRVILKGKLYEMRKASFGIMGISWGGADVLLKVLSFILMHPHRDYVEVVSEYEEDKYEMTNRYREVGLWE